MNSYQQWQIVVKFNIPLFYRYFYNHLSNYTKTIIRLRLVNIGEYSPRLRLGEYINNSLHLARKYARIFVRGHYLFREANSFPRAKLEENCELRGTDNVQGQISEHILAPNGGYCLYYPSNIFNQKRSILETFSEQSLTFNKRCRRLKYFHSI